MSAWQGGRGIAAGMIFIHQYPAPIGAAEPLNQPRSRFVLRSSCVRDVIGEAPLSLAAMISAATRERTHGRNGRETALLATFFGLNVIAAKCVLGLASMVIAATSHCGHGRVL
jgi:hypothetical protein